jgi:hypothetical protein
MAHFYGTLQGNRGKATRCGTRASGVTTVAASYSGAVRCETYVNSVGRDCVRVNLVPWLGCGVTQALYDGPLDPCQCPASRMPEGSACSHAIDCHLA